MLPHKERGGESMGHRSFVVSRACGNSLLLQAPGSLLNARQVRHVPGSLPAAREAACVSQCTELASGDSSQAASVAFQGMERLLG